MVHMGRARIAGNKKWGEIREGEEKVAVKVRVA
jgi:hypothetical protein